MRTAQATLEQVWAVLAAASPGERLRRLVEEDC